MKKNNIYNKKIIRDPDTQQRELASSRAKQSKFGLTWPAFFFFTTTTDPFISKPKYKSARPLLARKWAVVLRNMEIHLKFADILQNKSLQTEDSKAGLA